MIKFLKDEEGNRVIHGVAESTAKEQKGQSFTTGLIREILKDLSRKRTLMIFQRRYSRSSNTTPEDPFFGFGVGSNRTSNSSNRNTNSHSRATSSTTTSQQSTRLENTPQKGSDIHLTIKVEFREALFGSERKISVNRPIRWVPSSVHQRKHPWKVSMLM